jgi:hypothetical protein
MISLSQYVGVHINSPDWTPKRKANAIRLLAACSLLEARLISMGVRFPTNSKTVSQISGEIYGGFRPQSCPIGASKSSHKEGLAVDRYDPLGEIDEALESHPELLNEFGIYIEHPEKTIGWSHWTIKAPGSGKYIFYP